MGKSYRSEKSSNYEDGYHNPRNRINKNKAKKIKDFLETKPKVDKKTAHIDRNLENDDDEWEDDRR